MEKKNYASILDVALLEPETTMAQLEELCANAKKYGYSAVAVMPSRVKAAAQLLKGSSVKVDVAISFPFGMTTTAVKVLETAEAIDNGASEVDMVINIGKFRDGDYDAVFEDMKAVVDAAKAKGDIIVKAILETGLLTDEEIVKACELAEKAGMDFVKTSTGFSKGGANAHVLKLMKKSVSDVVEVKASGQVRTYENAVDFTQAGSTRLGCSARSALAIVNAYLNQD